MQHKLKQTIPLGVLYTPSQVEIDAEYNTPAANAARAEIVAQIEDLEAIIRTELDKRNETTN